ncbi:NAD-dependent epimerase/dehydratase family protein [Desulfosporosinus sp. OT]|uniref:NAD-dependent epimerase/dehydratase family protein n=1 Tax=Desulfosporosinus sp. OT TaxID=913865 RepID=UPI000223A0EE|nr:NAD-dependent epimerase/dehydratase family protein [Desulfosporosinus sp. OT]EGW41433.1 UDP-sulfoquinovose synthase [Desulfosporosinus sp. OT]
MKVLVLGVDGYLGWPTAMDLANKGHEVWGIDNYLRRDLSRNLDIEPLYSIPNLSERVRIFKDVTNKEITIRIGDLVNWSFISSIFHEFKPDVIIHYAEQPSAPYSMLSREATILTLNNNIQVTANVIFAVRQYSPEAHIIKLGTMGEYGTPNIDIEEGWLEIVHNGRKGKFLFPRQAGSLYHTTKIMDTDLLWFYVRMWDMQVTDLMQGPVYGLLTDESMLDHRLLPIFNYDEVFGTVLNRFLVQAVIGYPLTVYGKGGQTRGYLNIKDTLNCVRLSMENPPGLGKLRIMNQLTETFTVNQLAEMVKAVGDTMGLNVRINHIENPRKEAEEHYYNPKHTGLLELGLEPNFLTNESIHKMLDTIIYYKDNIQKSSIFRNIKW